MSPESQQKSWFERHLWMGKIHFQRLLIVITGLLLTLLIFIQVVTRYVFEEAIFGIEEVATYLAVWFYMLGAGVGAQQRGHISASLTDVLIKNARAQAIIKAITALISVILSGWMTVWGYQFAAWSFKLNMMSVEIGIPMWVVHMAIPLGLALMTLYFFIEFIQDVQMVHRGGEA